MRAEKSATSSLLDTEITTFLRNSMEAFPAVTSVVVDRNGGEFVVSVTVDRFDWLSLEPIYAKELELLHTLTDQSLSFDIIDDSPSIARMTPTSAEHLSKADRNKQFGLALNPADPTRAGWALVALFYAALHYTDAFFVTTARSASDNHKQRMEAIAFNPKLKAIYAQYRFLFNLGYNARYRTNVFRKTDVDDAIVKLELIESHIKSLL